MNNRLRDLQLKKALELLSSLEGQGTRTPVYKGIAKQLSQRKEEIISGHIQYFRMLGQPPFQSIKNLSARLGESLRVAAIVRTTLHQSCTEVSEGSPYSTAVLIQVPRFPLAWRNGLPLPRRDMGGRYLAGVCPRPRHGCVGVGGQRQSDRGDGSRAIRDRSLRRRNRDEYQSSGSNRTSDYFNKIVGIFFSASTLG